MVEYGIVIFEWCVDEGVCVIVNFGIKLVE